MTRRRRKRPSTGQEGQAQPQPQPQKPKGGGGGPAAQGKQAPAGKAPSPQAGKPGAGKPNPPKPVPGKPAPGKGKQPPQRRPPRETPEAIAERLLQTFPPKVSDMPEFLRSCRSIQTAVDGGTIPHPTPGELFYLIASCVETLAEDRIDRLFDSGYRQRLHEQRQAAGLADNEFFKAGDPRMSEEYKDLLEEFRSKKRELLAALFREHGQRETAELLVEDHHEYRRRRDEGRKSFISRDPLDPFVAQVISGEISHIRPEEDEEGDEEP